MYELFAIDPDLMNAEIAYRRSRLAPGASRAARPVRRRRRPARRATGTD